MTTGVAPYLTMRNINDEQFLFKVKLKTKKS